LLIFLLILNIHRRGEIKQNALHNFLSDRGREIVKRLDEIAVAIRRFYTTDPEKLDVDALSKLVEEGLSLVSNQGKE